MANVNDIKYIYLCGTLIKALYLGGDKLWPTGIPVGTVYNFDYTGTVQSVKLPPGRYKLQCWGAQGGTSYDGSDGAGSKGGYSEGVLTLTETTTLHVFVGGKGSNGSSTSLVNGGWNGGGASVGYSSYDSSGENGYSYPACGGGATDICTVTSSMSYSSGRTNRSSESLLSRIIVAGGGAGGSYYHKEVTTTTDSTSGYSNQSQQGGGTSGRGQYPGTQSSAGSGNQAGGFGYGANQTVTNYRYCSGGAGGGWYGGGTTRSDSYTLSINHTGGGSGFVNIAENASSRPSNYTGLQLDSGRTIAGDTSHPSINGGTEIGHNGNGYARITVVGNGLPTGYTRVTYVEFTGKQYVDTGFIPSNTTKLWMDFEIPTPIVGNVYYGSRDTFSSNSFLFAYSSISNKLRTQFGSQTLDHDVTIQGRHEITHDKNVVTLDGVTKTHNAVTFKASKPLYLGAENRKGTVYFMSTFRIYGCKIYDDGVLVRDFVPVKNSDGIVGLYDRVTDTFYTSGTGTDLISG